MTVKQKPYVCYRRLSACGEMTEQQLKNYFNNFNINNMDGSSIYTEFAGSYINHKVNLRLQNNMHVYKYLQHYSLYKVLLGLSGSYFLILLAIRFKATFYNK